MLLTMAYFFIIYFCIYIIYKFWVCPKKRKKKTDPRVLTYKHALLNNVVGFFFINYFYKKIRLTERPYKCQGQIIVAGQSKAVGFHCLKS